ncbi:MAG: hypothetical protein ACM30G_22340 [Micromonosporaceae bacterium]
MTDPAPGTLSRLAPADWLRRLYAGALTVFVPAPDRPIRPAGVALAAGGVMLGTAVGLVRQPGIGAFDTVWAEDGQVFLSGAVDKGLPGAIATPYAGYYHLVPRLLAEFAALFGPGSVPAVFAVESTLCTALAGLLVYVASGALLPGVLSRLLVSAVVVVMPLANEVPDSIANLHWIGLYAVFWVLVWSPRGVAGRIVGVAVIGLVAGSDILVLGYLPLALLRASHRLPDGRRDRYGLLLAGVLGTGLAIQIAGLLLGSSSRPLSPNPVPVVTGVVLRVVPSTLIGEQWLGADPHHARWLALTALAWLLLAVAILAAVRRWTRPIWPLALIAGLHCVGLYALPVMLEGLAIPRYAAAPVMLLVTALVAALQPAPEVARQPTVAPLHVLTALLALVWLANLRVVDNTRGEGPRWSDQLRQARVACAGAPAGTRIALPIPPRDDTPPWRANLPCRYLQR